MSETLSHPVLQLERLAICGLGLVGGSVLKGLRQAGYRGQVTGVDTDGALLAELRGAGLIDAVCDVAQAGGLFGGHDLVVLCQPVGALVEFLAEHRQQIGLGRAVVVDVASVKAPVQAALQAVAATGTGLAAATVVPCHPVAGKASHGWAAADAGLFQDRLCVMTPDASTAPQAILLARDLWSVLGSRTTTMAAEAHDRLYAAISHMPQLLSYAYLHSLAGRDPACEWLDYRGTGFQSFARLGASDPVLWADIALHNAAPLIEEIDRVCDALALVRHCLSQRKQTELASAFALARSYHAHSGLLRGA